MSAEPSSALELLPALPWAWPIAPVPVPTLFVVDQATSVSIAADSHDLTWMTVAGQSEVIA